MLEQDDEVEEPAVVPWFMFEDWAQRQPGSVRVLGWPRPNTTPRQDLFMRRSQKQAESMVCVGGGWKVARRGSREAHPSETS